MAEYSITVYKRCYIIDYIDTIQKYIVDPWPVKTFFKYHYDLNADGTLRAFEFLCYHHFYSFSLQQSDNINTTNANSYLAVQENQTTPLSTLTPAKGASLRQIKIKLNVYLRVCVKR